MYRCTVEVAGAGIRYAADFIVPSAARETGVVCSVDVERIKMDPGPHVSVGDEVDA